MADHILSDRDLDAIFRTARSHNAWDPTAVSDVQLEALYDLLRMGPTATNGSPARFVFCRSDAARATLADCVSAGNRDKVLEAPVTAIVGMDIDFHERLPQLFPHNLEARDWFADPEARREAALRNSSLQGAYMIVAARAIGLDCGPMSGFDKAKVDAAFFAGTRIEANFICSIGHGTDERLFARSPRLSFAEACRIA